MIFGTREATHISRIRLSSWRTTQEQRHLTVCNGLLREIIEDNDCVLAGISEEFTDRALKVLAKDNRHERYEKTYSSERSNVL